MKKLNVSKFPAALVACVLSVSSAVAATNFLGGDVLTATNWSNGLPVNGNTGTISVDGTFAAGQQSWLAVTGSYSPVIVTIDGGDLTKGDNTVLFVGTNATVNIVSGGLSNVGEIRFNRSAFNMSGGYLSASIIQLMGTSFNNVSTISGGTITTGRLAIAGSAGVSKQLVISGGTLNLTTGTGDIRFVTGGGWITFAAGNEGSLTAKAISFLQDAGSPGYLNFETGSKITLTITGYTESNYETLFTSGKLLFNGLNTGGFLDHFQVSGSTLSLIPEPAHASVAAGISALLLATFCRRRLKHS